MNTALGANGVFSVTSIKPSPQVSIVFSLLADSYVCMRGPDSPVPQPGFKISIDTSHSWLFTLQDEAYTYEVKITTSCDATKAIIKDYVSNSLAMDYNAEVAIGFEHIASASSQSWQCTPGDDLETSNWVYSDGSFLDLCKFLSLQADIRAGMRTQSATCLFVATLISLLTQEHSFGTV